MRDKIRFAVILAVALGIGTGAAVSGESDPNDPLSKWTKIETEELGNLAGLGVVVGDDNVYNEDSNNFTQKNYSHSDQDNEDSPFIVKAGDADGNGQSTATVATGKIYGDYFLNNRGLFVISKVSGILNNVSTTVQFNIYFQ